MRTSGEETKFWQKMETLAPSLKKAKLFVSDSHCFAHDQSFFSDHVILIDAHHDCWDNMPGHLDSNSVMCHNWARIWLKAHPKSRMTWVRPSWQKASQIPVPKDLKDRVDVVRGLKGLKQPIAGPTSLHVCRSGCWTPPWLDKAFLGFLESFSGYPKGINRLQTEAWDATVCRWNEKDIAEAREQDRLMQVQMENMRVGQISSRDFVNAKVEVAI